MHVDLILCQKLGPKYVGVLFSCQIKSNQIKSLFSMITCTKANDWSKSKQLWKLATQQINEQTQNIKQFYNFTVGVISVLLEFDIWCLLINGWQIAF